MGLPRRLAAIAVLCAFAAPAVADTANPPLRGLSTWAKIATASLGSVDVQNLTTAPIVITTSATSPGTLVGQTLLGGDHRCWNLSLDLYALGPTNAQVVVTSGVGCGISAAPLPTALALGSPSDAAVTQQSLTGLAIIGSRNAETASLGEWSVQSQAANTMYLTGYSGTTAPTNPATSRLWTVAIGPGAGQGKQGGDESYLQIIGPFTGPVVLWGVSGDQAMLTRQ